MKPEGRGTEKSGEGDEDGETAQKSSGLKREGERGLRRIGYKDDTSRVNEDSAIRYGMIQNSVTRE